MKPEQSNYWNFQAYRENINDHIGIGKSIKCLNDLLNSHVELTFPKVNQMSLDELSSNFKKIKDIMFHL